MRSNCEVLVVIPARLNATRLPGKPLALIAGKPMILHVWERAIKAQVGPVVVACGDCAIAEVVTKAGGNAVLTDPELPTGSDRVHAALHAFDPQGKYQKIINLQGDLPTFSSALLSEILLPFHEDPSVDISTLVTRCSDAAELASPQVVTAALSFEKSAHWGRALYFSRFPIPYGAPFAYHHIGIYAYTRDTLNQFVSYPQSTLEKQENLEQLRALEKGHYIAAVVVETDNPFGVDTPADLEKARALLDM